MRNESSNCHHDGADIGAQAIADGLTVSSKMPAKVITTAKFSVRSEPFISEARVHIQGQMSINERQERV